MKQNTNLSDDDITLMHDFYLSCQDDLRGINAEIDKLNLRRTRIKDQMTKRNIAEMFEISESQCTRILSGDRRMQVVK